MGTSSSAKRADLNAWLWAWFGLAYAGLDAWEAVYDGRLEESLVGDAQGAVAHYERALSYLPEDDPARTELMYWLGRSRWSLGDLDGARAALQPCLEDNVWQDRAWAFLSRLEAQTAAVQAIPYSEDFTRSFGALVRGWSRFSEGGLERLDGVSPYGTALSWSTVVREGDPDFLYLVFGEIDRTPRRIIAFLRARRFPAHVRFVLEGLDGQRWAGPVVELATAEWTNVDIALSEFVLEEDPTAERFRRGVRLRALYLYDVTAQVASDRGENVILVDDLELR